MLIQNTSISSIGKEKTLRFDVDYIKYHQAHSAEYYTFSELFDLVPDVSIAEEMLFKDFKYCEIGNVDKNGGVFPVALNFERRNLEDENYYSKIEKGDITAVELNDILIAKVRPNLKKYVRITEELKTVFFTSAFIRIRAKRMPVVLYYCLRSIFYSDLMAVSRQGKGYPTINEKDISALRFDKNIIDTLERKSTKSEAEIADIEKDILHLTSTIRTSQDIIDSVLQSELGFNYDKFEELKTHRLYFLKQSMLSNNPDLRFSVKYHRPSGGFVMGQLTELSDKKIKHFLAEPIALGASISPNDFDETGNAYYVSMATIKTFEVELDDTQLVSQAYYEAKKAKSLKKGDIVIARSGVAIGKTAIVKDEFDGIFADFTMRIRFDDAKYNPWFAYFYLRSKYFQYLIEVYKKGLQNQNIFPKVIQEFPVPDISIREQLRIVDEIQAEISKQDEVKNQVEKLRGKINRVIMKTIKV